MSRASNNDQFKFLISCIRWSNNGKVNFSEVAAECEIVSKGAAAKRYERMMKAHGILKPNEPAKSYTSDIKFEKPTRSAPAPSKKRKAAEFSDDQATQDDEESFASNVKQDPELDMEELHVKEEHEEYQREHGDGDDMIAFPLSEIDGQDEYGTASSGFYSTSTGGSMYAPSTGGYNTPAEGFIANENINPYDLRVAPQFMDFQPYQHNANANDQATSIHHAVPYQDDHIVLRE